MIKKAKFEYLPIGPGCIVHNYLCAVCLKESAVMEMEEGILQPCWDCQLKHFRVVKLNWFMRLLVWRAL